MSCEFCDYFHSKHSPCCCCADCFRRRQLSSSLSSSATATSAVRPAGGTKDIHCPPHHCARCVLPPYAMSCNTAQPSAGGGCGCPAACRCRRARSTGRRYDIVAIPKMGWAAAVGHADPASLSLAEANAHRQGLLASRAKFAV